LKRWKGWWRELIWLRVFLHVLPYVLNFFPQKLQRQLNRCHFTFKIFHISGNTLASLWVESLMVSVATRATLLRRHGSQSPGQLFSLSLAKAADSFRATFQWLNFVQLPCWEYLAV
jgi:hypothetical protein